MASKRALVVDDSRSACAFLAKLLREHHIEVDTAETAEQAIDYLGRNRPDVIFMDHLMPGMDGFQAVQAIKGNPLTAMIPIMMYTSQEGELYLGQARALGAVGVLPKGVAPADVRTVLRQLHLVDEPAAVPVPANSDVAAVPVEAPVLESPVSDAVAGDAIAPLPIAEAASVQAPVVQAPAAPLLEQLLKDEVSALRQQLQESMRAQEQRMQEQLRVLLRETLPPPPEPAPPTEPERPRHSPVPWLLALAASAAAAVLGTLLWQNERQIAPLRAELADSRANVSLLLARLDSAALAASFVPASGDTLLARVPFGEAPFGGARVEQLRQFVTRLVEAGRAGTVQVRGFTGRFCLVGQSGAYALAPASMPATGCDLVAAADDPALGPVETETVAFANALADLRREYGAVISIDVASGQGEPAGILPYPEGSGTATPAPTAGEWNAAAASHHRVEMRWLPAS